MRRRDRKFWVKWTGSGGVARPAKSTLFKVDQTFSLAFVSMAFHDAPTGDSIAAQVAS